MYVIHKLKPNPDFHMILIPLGSLVAAALAGALFGPETAFYFFGAFFTGFAAYTCLAALRTHNTNVVIQALYMTSLAVMAFVAPWGALQGHSRPLVAFLVACVFFFLVWTVILAATKKLKFRGREILELAAAPVEKTGNGYTPRPLAAGKTEFSLRQVTEFAEFARKHLIAAPYFGKDKVVLVPIKEGREFPFIVGLKSDYASETWVSFDANGQVTANISRQDYLSYREALAFDQLCASLANVFIEFVETYQRGEGQRIIDRLNAVGIPWHS